MSFAFFFERKKVNVAKSLLFIVVVELPNGPRHYYGEWYTCEVKKQQNNSYMLNTDIRASDEDR